MGRRETPWIMASFGPMGHAYSADWFEFWIRQSSHSRSSPLGVIDRLLGFRYPTLRKSWRIIGALDLVLAWIVASVVIIQGTAVAVLLAILVASAILLGLVTFLTQTYEGEMANE